MVSYAFPVISFILVGYLGYHVYLLRREDRMNVPDKIYLLNI